MQRVEELLLISINTLKSAETIGYSPALSTAKIILGLAKKRIPELETTIQETIDLVILAQRGFEIRPNVIKKLEQLYEEMKSMHQN